MADSPDDALYGKVNPDDEENRGHGGMQTAVQTGYIGRAKASTGLEIPTRTDLVLMRRAVNGGYGLSEADRREMVVQCQFVLRHPRASLGRRLSAIKTLASLDKMDLAVETAQAKQPQGGTTINGDVTFNVDLSLLSDTELKAYRELRAKLRPVALTNELPSTPGNR